MSVKQRRDREKLEIRQGILTAARTIAMQEGWQAVTIRKIAERIEYSPPTIYEHFENKEAVLLELLREGFQQLQAGMQAAAVYTDDPTVRVIKVATAYWNFAFNCPALYQVMYGLSGITFNRAEAPSEALAAFNVLLDVVGNWVQVSEAEVADIGDSTDIIWGVLHGLISLTMTGRISEGPAYARPLMEQAILALLSAWKTAKQA